MDSLIKIDTSLYKKDVSELTNQEIAYNLDTLDELIKRFDELRNKVKDEALIRLQDGGSIRGRHIVITKGKRKAKDINELFSMLHEQGISKEVFLGACDASLAKLESEYADTMKSLSGITKTQAKEDFKRIIEPYIEEVKETENVRRI